MKCVTLTLRAEINLFFFNQFTCFSLCSRTIQIDMCTIWALSFALCPCTLASRCARICVLARATRPDQLADNGRPSVGNEWVDNRSSRSNAGLITSQECWGGQMFACDWLICSHTLTHTHSHTQSYSTIHQPLYTRPTGVKPLILALIWLTRTVWS